MKSLTKYSLIAVVLLLSACGGGGGGGISSTPAPTPTPSPTYQTFTDTTSNWQIPVTGVYGNRSYVSTASGTTFGPLTTSAKSFSGGNVSITYDAATKSYTVTDGSFTSHSYGPDQLGPPSGVESAYTTYLRGGGTTLSEQLSIYRPEGNPKNSEPALSYTTLFMWGQSRYVSNSDNTETTVTSDVIYGVGGFQTLSSDMPKTGTANYSGAILGTYDKGSTIEAITGQSFLEANFATNTVEARISVLSPTISPNISIAGGGSIAGNKFSGSMSGAGYSGAYDGAFNGPRAKEMGYSFLLANPDGSRLTGVAGGRTP